MYQLTPSEIEEAVLLLSEGYQILNREPIDREQKYPWLVKVDKWNKAVADRDLRDEIGIEADFACGVEDMRLRMLSLLERRGLLKGPDALP